MAGSGGTSRFAVTCALLRQYMRKHQGRQGQTAGDLARLFQGPPAPAPPLLPVAAEDKDDRTMQLFPVRPSTLQSPPQSGQEIRWTMQLFPVRPSTLQSGQEIRAPEVTDKQAPMAILCDEVPQAIDETQMRAASLNRFLKKRKVRISDANPDNNDDSMTPAKKHATAGRTFLDDVPDPSWLSL